MNDTNAVPRQDELNQLLLQVAGNDREAFAQLYRRTAPRLLGVCTRMLVDRREAEEVLQEAYIKVWQRSKTFNPTRASAMIWLVALTRNKAIDRLRQRHAVATDRDLDIESVADEGATPAAQVEWGQDYRRLEECMSELEAQQRRSVQEAFFSGLTYNALAERAKVPLGTMKSWIRRGLLQLRACLEA
jgi:RNA polymerase sigma-70 factor (ECF subfamily)